MPEQPQRPGTGMPRFVVKAVSGVAVGLLAGLPLLAAGPAVAATPRIDFTGGGLGLLACGSQPSDRDVTVSAESTVMFVNKLGQAATLRIDGRNASRVPDDRGTEVLFHRGTVRVQMVPDCALNLSDNFQPVTITVLAPSGENTAPATPDSPDRSASATPGSGQTAAGTVPGQDGAGAQGTQSPRPAQSSPSGRPSSSASQGATQPEAGSVQGEALSGTDGEDLAAEPLESVPASAERGPNSLLAVIAAVCVVGVSAGAIRAIFVQRASRADVA